MESSVRIDIPAWFLLPWLFSVGAIIGSFLNVCIYRIPQHERLWPQLQSLWGRGSHCPKCKTSIQWRDNVPVFGWLLLGGRCRQCRIRISPRYPLIEFLNGSLWVLVYWLEVPLGFGQTLSQSIMFTDLGPETFPGLGGMSGEFFLHVRYVYHMLLIEALLVATFIDFDLRIIPDGSTLPAMLVGLLASWGFGRVHLLPVWFQSPNLLQTFDLLFPEWVHPFLAGPAVPAWITAHPHVHGFVVSLVGLLAGGGLVWIVRIIGSWALREEAMGFGDVILMALIGTYLGWQATIIAFFLGALSGSLVSGLMWLWSCVRRQALDRFVPFGPYLSLGALLTLLAWKHVLGAFRLYFELGVLILPMACIVLGLFLISLQLVQGVKRLFGLPIGPPPLPQEWTAADQNSFFAGEHVNRHTGRWRTDDWPGSAAARGQVHQELWRNGPASRPLYGPSGQLGSSLHDAGTKSSR